MGKKYYKHFNALEDEQKTAIKMTIKNAIELIVCLLIIVSIVLIVKISTMVSIGQ